jgi:hypothetical protein
MVLTILSAVSLSVLALGTTATRAAVDAAKTDAATAGRFGPMDKNLDWRPTASDERASDREVRIRQGRWR